MMKNQRGDGLCLNKDPLALELKRKKKKGRGRGHSYVTGLIYWRANRSTEPSQELKKEGFTILGEKG